MKKYLSILLTALFFITCDDEEHATLDCDLESYTIEELAALSDRFDAAKINHDQLLTDLTKGAIRYARYLGTWRNEEEGWIYNPVFGGKGHSSNWVFDANGLALYYEIYDTYYEGSGTPTTCHICTERTWYYHTETGEIIITPTEVLPEVRLKVLFYQSPLLYYSQTAVDPHIVGEQTKWLVDLRAVSNTQAKNEFIAYIKQ